MKLVSILAGIAFVIAVALIVRAAERRDARRAREWHEEQGRDPLDLGGEL